MQFVLPCSAVAIPIAPPTPLKTCYKAEIHPIFAPFGKYFVKYRKKSQEMFVFTNIHYIFA